MKNIKVLFLFSVLCGLLSCEADDIVYNGPDIAYFDKDAKLREEIDETNPVVSFRIVSPMATNYDREYKLAKRMGSSAGIEEGVDFNLLTKTVIIKAGSFDAWGKVAFTAERLSPKIDTLALGLVPINGSVANFDNILSIYVSERCEFDAVRYEGMYMHTSTMMKNRHNVTVVALRDNGQIVPNKLKVIDFYNVGTEVIIDFDHSDPARIVPRIKMQYGGMIETGPPLGLQKFFIHTSEQYAYPNLPASENKSHIYTCSGEIELYLTFGVFPKDADGNPIKDANGLEIEGFLQYSPTLETLEKLTSPYSAGYRSADNYEFRAVVK
ncbi:MAG: hypothetical protein RR397_02325 [Odoribacter sp.]